MNLKKTFITIACIAFVCLVPTMAFAESVKKEDSVINYETENSKGIVSTESNANILDGKASATAAAGFSTNSGYGAKVNANISGCVANAEEKVKIGNEDVNVSCAMEGSAGKVSASAGAGIYYNNGKVSIGANAGAQAIAVETKASVTGNIEGVEAKVTGGVQVGVGAKGKVTLENAKLEVNVSAALGIGAEIGFEIDVSGLIETFCNDIAKTPSSSKFSYNPNILF